MSFLSQLHFMTPKKNLTSLQNTVSPPTSRNTNDHNLYTNSLVLRLESHSRLASMWLLHRSGSLQEQETEDPGKWLRERTLQIGTREGRGQFQRLSPSRTGILARDRCSGPDPEKDPVAANPYWPDLLSLKVSNVNRNSCNAVGISSEIPMVFLRLYQWTGSMRPCCCPSRNTPQRRGVMMESGFSCTLLPENSISMVLRNKLTCFARAITSPCYSRLKLFLNVPSRRMW